MDVYFDAPFRCLTPVLRPEFLDISIDAFRIYRRYDVSIANVFGGSFEIRLLAGFRTSDHRLRFVLEDVSARVDPQLTDPELVGSAADLEARLTTEFPAAVNARLPEIVGQVVEVGGDPLSPCNPGRGLEADRLCFDVLPGVLEARLPSLGPDALEPRNVACLPTDGRGACGILPNFRRVHGRPEGIEAVLSEWSPEEEEAGRGEADPLYPVLQEAGACDRSSAPERPVEAGYFGSIFEIPPAGTPLPFGDAP